MERDSVETKQASNIGLDGIDSILIGGMKVHALPMAEFALTKQQWEKVIADNKKQEVENILADYPKQKISYLSSRIVECKSNIERIKQLKKEQQTMINDYKGHIAMCSHRDLEITKLDARLAKNEISEVEYFTTIKELKIKFPLYDVKAMLQQINQCQDAISRCDEIIDQEHDSIAELKGVIFKCQHRDLLLKPYGIEIG